MILGHFTLWPLFFSGPAAAAPPEVPAIVAPTLSGEFEQLVDEYEKATADWNTKVDAADQEARRELRKSHPAKTFWSRFETLGKDGEGRALLWMVGHTRDKGLSRKEAGPVKKELYERIFRDHLEAEWLRSAVSQVARDVRDVGEDEVATLLESAAGNAKAKSAKVLASLKLAELLSDSDDAAKKARGERLLEEYERKFIGVGAEALDFDAATVDGHEFKLSDYRGKVVLVDFYGFW